MGGGFQEFLTLENPSSSQTASVTITYLIQGGQPKTVTKSVPADARQTVNVDSDLGDTTSGPHYSVAAIVSSTVPIVAERPMYFSSVAGVASGTDVVGATNPGTSYYFSEADSSSGYTTFISMMNPSSTATANVIITYYTGGCGGSGQAACPTEQKTIGPLQRQTALPNDVGLHQKVAIKVTADNPIVVERPMYFKVYIPNAGGLTTGAASEVGATSPGTDWLFAEGYTGTDFQEYLELANFGSSPATASIKLEYTNGDTQTVQVTVPALGFTQFDVNNANAHPGTCNPSPCQVTGSVSAEVTSDNPIVADRLMYFHFSSAHISGGTDVVGTPAANSIYAFAEGYTANTFTEFLTLQNPTSNAETVAVTLFTQHGLVFQQQVVVGAHTRSTLNINDLLNPMGADSVSMVVQVIGSNGTIVAERPMYFIFAGNEPGGTDVIGYTGQ